MTPAYMKSGYRVCSSVVKEEKNGFKLDLFSFVPQLTQFQSVHHNIEPPSHYWLFCWIYGKSLTCLMPWTLIMRNPARWLMMLRRKEGNGETMFGSWSFTILHRLSPLSGPFFIDVRRTNILKVDIWVGLKAVCYVWWFSLLYLTSRLSERIRPVPYHCLEF